MKNFFKKITAFICIMMFVLSMSGCSLILDLEDDTVNNYPGEYYSEVTVDVTLSKQLIFCDTYDKGGFSTTNNVKFNSNQKAEDFEKFEYAAKEVNRSIVKIIMKDELGKDLSYGSGIIVDIEGGLSLNEYYILTCHHVISGAGNISICVPDANLRNHGDDDYDEKYIFNGYIGGEKSLNPFEVQEVSLVGGDRDADVAVLKLNASRKSISKLQKASFPQTENFLKGELEYAQEVFAIGNPTGQLPMTFLSGNISYLDRTIALDSIGYMKLIQHDCLITHGNSGGGLFNMKGQLIGITNAGSDVYKGMNYAIPYYGKDGFMAIAEKLIKSSTAKNYGYVEGRWNLGVTISEAENSVKGSSVSVVSVEKNSNVDGLMKTGDYILKVEYGNYSKPITSMNEFKDAVFHAREDIALGDTMKITIARLVQESII